MTNALARWLLGTPDAETETPTGDAAEGARDGEMSDAADVDGVEDVDGADVDIDGTDDVDEPTSTTGEPAADDGLTVEDLEYRIDELESNLEETTTTVEATRRGQEDVAESIDELDDTVRRLLGVYDRLTNDANPFAGDEAEGEGGRFGLVGRPAETTAVGGTAASESESASESDTPRERAGDDDPGTDSPADVEGGGDSDDAVDGDDPDTDSDDAGADDPNERGGADDTDRETTTYADLKRAVEESKHEGTTEDEEATVDTVAADGAPTDGVSVDGTSAAETSDGISAENPGIGDAEADARPADGALLTTLGRGYATDVLVFEWLATLVDESGPAGTLKALDYYETVDWIAPPVREQLEGALGGPKIDVDVDPSEPRDLSASHHADSYEYVLQLRELERLGGALPHTEAEG
jgi:archaellum component FlaD/FlaE